MPRPKRRRMVEGLPPVCCFAPKRGNCPEETAVVMTVEEYEALRLIDYVGLTQEECAASMEVGRTTVQQIYVDARRKLSTCLVEGRPLLMQGGEYELAPGRGRGCGRGACRRRGREEDR